MPSFCVDSGDERPTPFVDARLDYVEGGICLTRLFSWCIRQQVLQKGIPLSTQMGVGTECFSLVDRSGLRIDPADGWPTTKDDALRLGTPLELLQLHRQDDLREFGLIGRTVLALGARHIFGSLTYSLQLQPSGVDLALLQLPVLWTEQEWPGGEPLVLVVSRARIS